MNVLPVNYIHGASQVNLHKLTLTERCANYPRLRSHPFHTPVRLIAAPRWQLGSVLLGTINSAGSSPLLIHQTE